MSPGLTLSVAVAVAGERMDLQVPGVPAVVARRPTVGQAQPGQRTQAAGAALEIRTLVLVARESLL
jgi:hypothetical protein